MGFISHYYWAGGPPDIQTYSTDNTAESLTMALNLRIKKCNNKNVHAQLVYALL